MRHRTVRSPAALAESLLNEFPELLAVYHFGSSGGEHERSTSDIDLAVYAGALAGTWTS